MVLLCALVAGFMRSWGRDTFISFKGLLLVTGRFEDAKQVLLSFASVVRHGLIPNLMDSARNPRYNARDATWWFLQALQEYCVMVPDGHSILSTLIYRAFPSDEQTDCAVANRDAMTTSHLQYIAEYVFLRTQD